MAKATGPLYSMSASGKIADAMVFFGWKGVNVVRQWLIPHNKMSANQGNQRTMLAGTGKAVGKIYPNPGHVITSKFARQLITMKLLVGTNTKQSYLVQYILNNYLTDATAFAAKLAEFTAHTYSAVFDTAADALGITEFSLPYDTIAAYNKGLGLYLIAKFATDKPLSGTPYTLALASWITASISAMISDFTVVA